MKEALQVLQGLALASFVALCVFLSLAVHSASERLNSTLQNADNAAKQITVTLSEVNGKHGTIDQLNDAIRDVRLIVAHSDRLMTQQQQSLVLWNSQISTTIADVQGVLTSVKGTSNITAQSEQSLSEEAVGALKGIPPVLSSANAEIANLELTTQQLNKLLSDPNLIATEAHVAGTTKNLEDTSQDAKDYFHALLHPTWVQRVWGVTLDIAGHLLDPF